MIITFGRDTAQMIYLGRAKIICAWHLRAFVRCTFVSHLELNLQPL
eukprot:UN16056